MDKQELAAGAFGGFDGPSSPPAKPAVRTQSLERQDGGIHRRMGRATRSIAVPTPVGHLLVEQILDQGVEALIVEFEVRQDREHDPSDAGLASTAPRLAWLRRGGPASKLPSRAVNAPVAAQPMVEQESAGGLGLPMARRQPEIA